MPSFFELTLRTIPPQNIMLRINAGESHTNDINVVLTISTSDTVTTGYQMKIWGIDGAVTESVAIWEPFVTTRNAKLLYHPDGIKTVYVRLRDNVLNESETITASIVLDTMLPKVSIVYGPDHNVISITSPRDVCRFDFVADEVFIEYMIMIVQSGGSLHTEGINIPMKNGSQNMSGENPAGFPVDTPIQCTINGNDLICAVGMYGTKIIKIFVKDFAGNWSV